MNQYTWLGLSSILIWASLVAVVKLVTESLSPVQAVALIYSFSALFMLWKNGFPKLSLMPKIYLMGCGALFVGYEILFLISIALSTHREQVLIITMINYLWPPLLIVFSILARQLSANIWVIAGFTCAILGLMMVVNPDILEPKRIFVAVLENPLAYSFAFIGAVLWPLYSIFTKKYAEGHNAVPFLFLMTAVGLWAVHFVMREPFVELNLMTWLMVVVIGSLIGLAYSNWNQSMQYGHLKILILATYFMPIFSSLMSMLILDVQPLMSFWIGCVLVTLGALICWQSTRPYNPSTK
ncbi:aromatic amino acid DMT transporter YddG [Acinetobacter sp. YH12239]|uniref:aromatic amino acid DMT transporter YddG n=1 Tax=Acinetobacter sp. YH12239 TaxID=2601166 RepID=UPI001C553521|nr:aromatic amino acid DMT transporter YddG [Acinetobacter sp. YH12239]